MADPLTSTLRLTEPTIGGDTGLWAGFLNNNMIFTDQGVNQTISVAIPDTNVTLVADGTTGDQARYHAYTFTGALTADRTVTIPNVQRSGYVQNNTTGGHNTILSAGGGTTITVPGDGFVYLFSSDGATNVVFVPAGFGSGSVIGAWTVKGAFTASGAATFNSSSTFVGSAGFNGTATFNGASTFNGTPSTGAGVGANIHGLLFNDTGTSSVQAAGFQYSTGGALGYAGGSLGYGIQTTQNIVCPNVFVVSDARLKFNIVEINRNEAVEWVKASRPVEYLKRPCFGAPDDAAGLEAGFIAQEQVRAGMGRFIMPISSPGMPALDEPDMQMTADHAITLSEGYKVAYLVAALKSALLRIEALENGSTIP